MPFEWQDRRWHVRLYLWAEPIVAKFFDRHSSQTEGVSVVRTNLCPYVRTIVLWMPLVLFTNVAAYVLGALAFLVFPFKFFGFWGVTKTLLGASAFILAIILVVALWDFLSGVWREVKHARRTGSIRRMRKVDETPSGFGVVRARLQAIHDGICPNVTISRQEVRR